MGNGNTRENPLKLLGYITQQVDKQTSSEVLMLLDK